MAFAFLTPPTNILFLFQNFLTWQFLLGKMEKKNANLTNKCKEQKTCQKIGIKTLKKKNVTYKK
jgi:hypothetical protein